MKKILPAIIVALVVLASAGAVFWWVDGEAKKNIELELLLASSRAPVADERPLVMWSVTSSRNEDAKGYSYSLATKRTTGPTEGFDGPGVARFNQSTSLCSSDSQDVPLGIECDYDSVTSVLELTVVGMLDGKKRMRAYSIDLKDLGEFLSSADGYLTPVAVAEDKSAIYLGRRVETESYVAGLWRLDVATGAITEIEYVRENAIYQYDINPTSRQLIGTSFVPPENLGADPSGPSSVHLVDLTSGAGSAFEESGKETVFENPMLSEDKPRFSFYESGGGAGSGRTVVLSADMGRYGSGWEIDGVVRDWFGDTMVVDRDGNLFLYDLATKVETQLTHETDATVEYLGVVR